MDYIECLFIDERVADAQPGPIPGAPHLSVEAAVAHIGRRRERGITRFLVFGVPAEKGLARASADGAVVPRFLRAARQAHREAISLIADVGLSPYSENGHSVVLAADGSPDEDASYSAASGLAVAFARAGADTVAPCLSLPRQVAEIAQAMDAAGVSAAIMPYSAKFSSAFYGPYRAAVRSSLGGARKAYQSDYTEVGPALAQVGDDIGQGASTVIVKPTMLYLDVLAEVCRTASVPVAAYHVSGEHLALSLAAADVGMDAQELYDEFHAAVARCGADYVIGYAADAFLRRPR